MSTDTYAASAASAAEARTGGDHDRRRLLQSIVEVARAIFAARASSIFLCDSGELVFEAVSGAGEEFLIGRRFPADRGIAGWVVASGEPMIIDDVSGSATFAHDLARSTGYVPSAIMAVPLLHDENVGGVLEVLDPAPQARSAISELDLLSLFAMQAALALRIAERGRSAAAIEARGGEYGELISVMRAFEDLGAERREAGLRLLGSLRDLLA
ncbi:GAF domain-containing protein [Planotetraspora sp. A-T 1434]|uniref:GAF domain-containing protein n=1 Tax=Planotetraspora sp. A-T 1434 TaxID=2979219 RepID=UPI0021C1C12F|nr:GAF domain-containing protein [Planotetraspora sp. A-T 1434]MCT9933594.1 GAF domain-containing protein [Planotetraspora sp. A-T 1434]